MAYVQHDLSRSYLRAGRMMDAREAYENSQENWQELNNLPMLADNLASLAEAY